MVKCGKIGCQICNFVEGENFTDSFGKRKYVINYESDCDSKGVVYLIKCKRCGKQYIGGTINTFRTHFNNHKSSLVSDLEVKIIDKTNTRDPMTRDSFWVYKLKTFLPYGLNLWDF